MKYEVIVIGGGAAGLSAALVLGRARRRVLVLDAGEPSNAVAGTIGGLLGQHETSPQQLLETGRTQIEELPTVELRRATAGAIRVDEAGVEVDGDTAEALLLATGMQYRLPDLPGIEEVWGNTVFHCPFCHGWEVRDQPLAVLAPEPEGSAMATLLQAWSDDVALLAKPGTVEPERRATLEAAGVTVVEKTVAGLESRFGRLRAVHFEDGSELARVGMLIRTPLEQRNSLAADLGLELTTHGTVVADAWGRTNLPRVWAAGDIAEPAPSITVAIAAGSRAAGGIVHDLMLGA